jgi:TetR/AcrR family transcriptional regulator, regulator of cefoperazone and chloramphenicol sensitivity
MKRSSPSPLETGDRIIAAAGEVFAEQGFRNTTIRQITARAGVNVAAVNYHFRDKDELYTRVLREAKKHVAWIRIDTLQGTPETRLRSFIKAFVSSLLNPQRPAWHGRVIGMEMANPTAALNVIVRELTAPLYRDVSTLVDEIVEGKAPPAKLDLFTITVIGQCVFYACGRPVVERLALDLGRESDRTGQIAEHVADVSLAALRAFRRQTAAKPARASRARSLAITRP